MKSPYSSLVLAIFVGGCASAPPPKAVIVPPPVKSIEVAPEAKPPLMLPAAYTQKGVAVKIDGLWKGPEGQILGVSGTAKNVTSSDLRFCQVSVAFLDAQGAKIDDAKASTKLLKSAQIWHFQAALAHPSDAAYAMIAADKTIAIPASSPKAELANLK